MGMRARRVAWAGVVAVLLGGPAQRLEAQGAAASGRLAAGETVELPLAVVDGHLVVTARGSDGTELRFGLTTGSSVPVLTRSGAERVKAAGGVTLGGLPVPTADAHVTDDADLMAGRRPLDGQIGPGVLDAHDVLIDAPGGRLVLRGVGRERGWPGVRLSDPVPLRVYHGIILGHDAALDGKGFGAMLNLGSSATVVNAAVGEALGLAGPGRARLTLGATEVGEVPVRVEDLEVFRMWAPDGRGFVLVGSAFVRDCAISLSWVHREMRTCVR